MQNNVTNFDKFFLVKQRCADIQPRFFLRTRLMLNLLKGEKGTLFDIGCGEGNFLKILTKHGFKCTGIDISDAAVKAAIRNVDNDNVKVLKSDIFTFSSKEPFDILIMGEVLEHVEDDESFLKRANYLLKDHGCIVMSVPIDKRLWDDRDKEAGHFRRYDKNELFQKLERAGFSVQRYIIWGFPLTRILYSWLRRQVMFRTRPGWEKKRDPIVRFRALFKVLKWVFLIDNLFNFTEKGVGIIVKARKMGADAHNEIYQD